MKKLMIAIFSMALCAGFTACGNDDDNSPSIASSVTGIYTGQSSAAFKYSARPIVNDGDSVVLTQASDNTVNVEYKSRTWGRATFRKALVSEDANYYTISQVSDSIAMPQMNKDGATKNYTASFSGKISKTDKKNFTMTVSVPTVMGGTVITIQPSSK